MGEGPRFLTQYTQGTKSERHVEATIAAQILLIPAAASPGGGDNPNGPHDQGE